MRNNFGKKTVLHAVFLTAALFCAQGLMGQTPKTAEEFNKRGLEYYSKGDYQKAIADFTQAIKLNPNRPNYYYNR